MKVVTQWMMTCRLVSVLAFGVLTSAWADTVSPLVTNSMMQVVRQDLQQGGFLIGKAEPVATVEWRGERVPVDSQTGLFVVGFDRKEADKGWLKVCVTDQCAVKTIKVAARDYKVQHIKGVPPKTVNPDPKDLARAEKDSAAINAARAASATGLAALTDVFSPPVKGARISGVYGSSRTYNGEERNWHKGLDFAAKTGTRVGAPADGVVVLARNTFFNGNLIILDHGARLYTIYAHLDSMAVTVGQKVARGDKLGEVGTTGRSTGPHLHWGVYWKNMALDPNLWLKSSV